jgi:excisionase family DNA binding protein
MSDSILTPLDGRATVALKEIAERIGVPAGTVRRWAVEGKVPGAFQAVGKWSRWRFKRDVIENWYQTLPFYRPAVAVADPRPPARKAKRKAAK